jgi:hypothetical protein
MMNRAQVQRYDFLLEDAENKESVPTNLIGKFSLDGRNHQTGDEALTPAKPHDLKHSRADTNSHNAQNTQHTREKQNTLFLYEKGHSTQTDMFWTTHHTKPDSKSIRVIPFCLWVL